ncbi:MAG: restriction endonuclease subunit S, partial [Oscillospiraceae bacterium]|nr:restriction endonuclease subunit S [Oscillospiraceae bacterium]
MARLGDVCDILNGFAFKSEQYVEEGIRIIRIANVQKGYIEDSTPVFYPYDSKDAKKYSLEEDDMLMSLTGNVGRVAKLSKEFLPAALNQRVACLRIKDGVELDKAFLFNLLNSDYFEQQCIAASKGVAQKNMSTEWLKEYEIPMFSLEQQKKIAAVLDEVSELISLRKEQLTKLDQLVKSRFIELFGDPEHNEKTIPTLPMTELCEIIDGDRGANYPKQEEFSDNGFCLFLNAKNVTANGF